MICRTTQQVESVSTTALNIAKCNAFALIHGSMMYCMLKSEEHEVREKALQKILSVGAKSPKKEEDTFYCYTH